MKNSNPLAQGSNTAPASSLRSGVSFFFMSDRDGLGNVRVIAPQELQNVEGKFYTSRAKNQDGTDKHHLRIHFKETGDVLILTPTQPLVDAGIIEIVNDEMHFVVEALGYAPNEDTTKDGTFITTASVKKPEPALA